MAGKPIRKMLPEDRAKQFMPFAALRGLNEALEEKEKIRVEKIELSEDMERELDIKMHRLERGKKACVLYYDEKEREYLKITGLVAGIDVIFRKLRVVGTDILFDDIMDVSVFD